MYSRCFLFIILFFCLTLKVTAQKLFTLDGTIYRKSTSERVSQVSITNLNTKVIMLGDELGGFHIEAGIGDTLLFKKAEYASQTVLVSSSYAINVYLQPVIALKEVSIMGGESTKQQLNDAMNSYRMKGGYYTLDPSALSFVTSPLTGLYELFGSAPAQARKFRQFSKEEMERIEVEKRYNRALVKKTIDIPDDEIQPFMNTYTPLYEDIITWTDYEILTYIKTSYQYYKDNKNRAKVQKLY
jgi:hypothetical protein